MQRGERGSLAEPTQKVLKCFQRRRRIDVLMLLFHKTEGEDRAVITWSDAKQKKINDHTFRAACKDLQSCGLVASTQMHEMANKHELTDLGCLVASRLDSGIWDIDILLRNKERALSIA